MSKHGYHILPGIQAGSCRRQGAVVDFGRRHEAQTILSGLPIIFTGSDLGEEFGDIKRRSGHDG